MDRTRPIVAKVALAFSLLTGSSAGLAYAGVDLPGNAAEKAFAQVGIDLPNQTEGTANGKSVSGAVKEVKDSTSERGCEFGQAVAAAASSNSQGQPEGDETPDPCTQGETNSAEGKAKAQDKAQGSKATGESKSAEGKAKAQDKAQGSKATGESKSAEGKAKAQNDDATGEDKAQGSKATGESKSAEGKAKAQNDAGSAEE